MQKCDKGYAGKAEGKIGSGTLGSLKVISAKDLGRLNLPEFCPSCFWLERHISKPPAIFPGIFSVIDSVTKKGVSRSFSESAKPPKWLPIRNLAEVEHGSTYFKLPIPDGDWVLTGRPDDVFKLKDGSYHIVDYKTAKFTGRQDELLPLYEVQLNCYAFLAEAYGLKPVSEISLVYYEPNEELNLGDDFSLGFKPYALAVDLRKEVVPRLLRTAREILNQQKQPAPRSSCKGICRWADAFLARCAEDKNLGST